MSLLSAVMSEQLNMLEAFAVCKVPQSRNEGKQSIVNLLFAHPEVYVYINIVWHDFFSVVLEKR